MRWLKGIIGWQIPKMADLSTLVDQEIDELSPQMARETFI
jgi:hypothetical protein